MARHSAGAPGRCQGERPRPPCGTLPLGFRRLGTYVSTGGELGEILFPSTWSAPSTVGILLVLLGFAGSAILVVALLRARRLAAGLAAERDARETELRVVHAAAREILTSGEPARVVAVAEREVRRLLAVDRFRLLAIEADPGSLHELRPFVASFAEAGPGPDEETMLRRIALEKCPVLLHDRLEDAAFGRLDVQVNGEPIRSLLAVPLFVGDRVLGILSVGSRRAAAYTAAQLELLTTLAQQAASALENARHHEAATVDSLTGLFQRDYFFRRLQEEFHRSARYGGSFALLMLDLDEFKQINDRHGHLAGDRYLRSVGPALRTSLRLADLACRYGGDEFCILLPETDSAGARIIAERIRAAVGSLVVDADGAPVRTTASIGLAVHPLHDGGDLKALLRAADQALYRAKRMGRDRVVPWAA
jgi:diguanylate cyclase (GGDEF)-like protein